MRYRVKAIDAVAGVGYLPRRFWTLRAAEKAAERERGNDWGWVGVVGRRDRDVTSRRVTRESTRESRLRVAAQAAKTQVVLSKRLGIKVDPRVEELARKAHY